MAFSKKPNQGSDEVQDATDMPTFLDFDGPGEVTAMERFGRWMVLLIALALAGWVTWAMASAFVPRWWAQNIGHRVDGSFTSGVAWGFGLGFFATVLSLLILVQARRRFLAWWGRLLIVVLAVAVSAPSFMTLAVTIGSGKAANAGRRIFDVNAPGFQWASLVGVVTGVLVFVLFVLVVWTSRRNKRKVSELRHQVETAKPMSNDSTVSDD